MPRIEDIEQFVSTLNEAGHEQEILSGRGEAIEAIPRPAEGLAPDLAELFAGIPTEEPSIEESSLEGPTEEPTMGAETAPGEVGETPIAEETAPPPVGEEDIPLTEELSPEESVDSLDQLFGSEPSGESAGGEGESFEMPDFSALEEQSSEEELSGESSALGEEEEFQLPDFAEGGEEPAPPSRGEEEKKVPEEEGREEIPGDEFLFDMPTEGFGDVTEGQSKVEESFDGEGGVEGEGKTEALFPSVDEGEGKPKAGKGTEPEISEVEEISVDELGGEEFSLGDFGAEFGILEEEKGSGIEEEPAINIPAGAEEAIAEAAGEEQFTLSDEEFAKLKQALAELPLNLKRAVEEVIGGNKASDEDQIKLIRYLITGERINTIASFTGKLIGRSIKIPKGYEKRTGLAYEEERESFAYVFREKVLPLIQLTLASVAVTTLLFYLGYQFIYRPLYAQSLYKKGYALVEAERYREGNGYFEQANRIWQDKEWYFRYADLFVKKKQFSLAQAKYEELLAQYKDYIHPRTQIWTERKKDSYFERGVLEYANLESKVLENFEKAEKILKMLLNVNQYHWDGLLALGDNYVRWAEYAPEKYQQAGKVWGILLQHYGDRDVTLFRFLELFVLTDDLEEVTRLKEYFQSKEKLKVDVERYALLGGYLLDKGQREDSLEILMRAYKTNPNVPEVHYHLARLFRATGRARDERIALDRSLELYLGKESLSKKELWKLIDVYRRDGEYRLERGEVLEAEKSFQEGIKRYEEAVSTRLIKANPTHGLLYVGLGNLYYYEGQKFREALQQYVKAEASFVQDPELSFRKGYVYYHYGNYETALLEFLKTESKFPQDPNVLFAIGNALYQRNNYASAAGYYRYLLEKLTEERRKVRYLEPHIKTEDRNLVLNLMKTQNNLGVALKRLSDRTRRPELSSEALSHLTASIELYENYSRDRETKIRGETKNLAYQNMRKVLNPSLAFDLQIYLSIPIDLRNQEF